MPDPDNVGNAEVLGLSHLLLQVADLDAAEKFYCGLLGLNIRARGTFGGDRPLISTLEGIGMTTRPAPGEGLLPPEKRNVEHIALWVKGMDDLVAKIEQAGFHVDGPKRNEYGLSMSVRDPDGNRVECIERLST
jgi:catechol 2,3-dioxygenase-like lactoylglutathione lyase family enzyme